MDKFDQLMSKPHLDRVKKQHYVPRFYLDGFTKNNLLSRLEPRTGKSTSPSPEGAAYIPNLYTFIDREERRRYDIEKLFGHVENQAAPIIKKMAARGLLNLDEREHLTTFIALSAVRTPAAIEEAQATYAAFIKAKNRLMLSDEKQATHWLRKTLAPELDELLLQEKAAEVVKMINDDAYTVDVDREFAIGKSLRNFSTIANAIYERDWMVLYAPEGSDGFLTTDHPVVLTTTTSALRKAPLGYHSTHAQVLFPLAHNCALAISGSKGRTGRADIELNNLLRFNRTMAAHCHRYLFGRSEAHLKLVARDMQLLHKPWQSSYLVTSSSSTDGRYSDIHIRRDGMSPLDEG